MSTDPLRFLVAVVMLVLLVRAGAGALRHRALAIAVWRGIRLRHVAGALGLLVAVVTVAAVLLEIPFLRYGIGSALGFSGNAVFAPLEEAAVRSGAGATGRAEWILVVGATIFLGFLAALLPWLAFVEEEVFRAGLEDAPPRQEMLTALRFGLVHLVMLVPIAAALAIGVAGLVYGRLYRRRYRLAGPTDELPLAVARSYRPTRRALSAARRAAASATDGAEAPVATLALPLRRQAGAVYESTVWHATFNSLVVGLVWLAIVLDAIT
ncbi:MAG: hypothetical protein ACRDUY_03140 [Nitriliruptorales bacterium]